MFTPIILQNIFDDEDINRLNILVQSRTGRRVWYDDQTKRDLIHHDDLEQYFSKKLEPIAKKIFNDETLKTSFTLYAKYDSESSHLPEHVDRHACVYTLDYCLSSTVDWPIIVDGIEYSIKENEALAFMGMDSPHSRKKIPSSDNPILEMVFFHFVPEKHWYFDHCKDFMPDKQ
jgi:hypothetical protein